MFLPQAGRDVGFGSRLEWLSEVLAIPVQRMPASLLPCQVFADSGFVHGLCKEIALDEIAPQVRQFTILRRCFHALGHDSETETVSQRNDSAHDDTVVLS